MKLPAHTRRLLGRARLGMLAIKARQPLVNPSAFHFDGESIWMTTSRYAAKVPMTQRDPRVGFMVSDEAEAVLLRGTVEPYDPRSLSSNVGALLQGPSFLLGLAGYALKNTAFVAGYLVDLAGVPAEWRPQNRVVLRMRVSSARSLDVAPLGSARRARVPAVPVVVNHALRDMATGYLCWISGGSPLLVPCRWAASEAGFYAQPLTAGPGPADGDQGAVVVEYHHPFRATRMVGACLRGPIVRDGDAAAAIAERYDLSDLGGSGFRIDPTRVTHWRGFRVGTQAVRRSASPEPVAQEEVRSQAAR